MPDRTRADPRRGPAPAARQVRAEGVRFTLPERWEEQDLTNVTTVRGGPAPTRERRWAVLVDPADPRRPGTLPVAALTCLRTDPPSPPTAPEEQLRERIRAWVSSTVASLAATSDARLGASLELEGVGCAPGTVTFTGRPRAVAFGPDGPGQAIRMDYRGIAFRDPSLGAVLGHRYVTTDTAGRRIDLHVNAYEGYLREVAADPGQLGRIVDSISPSD